MSEPELVTVADLKEGDRVRVTFEVDWKGRYFVPGSKILLKDLIDDVTTTIHRLPPKATPLEVGERVTWGNGIATFDVMAVSGSRAWIADEQDHRLILLTEHKDFRRVNGPPIEVNQ